MRAILSLVLSFAVGFVAPVVLVAVVPEDAGTLTFAAIIAGAAAGIILIDAKI